MSSPSTKFKPSVESVLISCENAGQPCPFILCQGHQLIDDGCALKLIPHGIQIVRLVDEKNSIHGTLRQFSEFIDAIVFHLLSTTFLEDVLTAQL